MTAYQQAVVDGSRVFYREAGAKDRPTILLLHGFPTSSHMFRNLIPALADRYHLVAPDLPGFGFSGAPDRKQFRYNFDNLAKVVDRFTQTIGIDRYALYIFDYGAPVGLRLALAHPERITAIISQNGNAYEEGLSQGWNPIQKYWKEPTAENRAALREFLTPEATKSQYLYGVTNATLVAPEAYALDSALLARSLWCKQVVSGTASDVFQFVVCRVVSCRVVEFCSCITDGELPGPRTAKKQEKQASLRGFSTPAACPRPSAGAG